MNESNSQHSQSEPEPFTALGTHLKYLREQQQESLAEVSGAVEIGIDNLERFEKGVERPSEDILLLMISHFRIADKEAGQLWELAGYDQPVTVTQIPMSDFKLGSKQQMLMVLALDMRTLYSDEIEINVNDTGVVMNFSQGNSQSQANAAPVARVGMSIEQARKVLQSLEQALLKAQYLQGPKQLAHGLSNQSHNKSAKQRRSSSSAEKSSDKPNTKKRDSNKDLQDSE
jgi:transcriptional regulator with XRE-family HTH domain